MERNGGSRDFMGHRLLGLLALLVLPSAAFAHRLDEYLQATLVVIEPDELRLEIQLTPGVAVAQQVLDRIDRDHNNVISTNEAAAYAKRLGRDLVVHLDQRKNAIHLIASTFPPPAELRAGTGIIQLEFSLESKSFAAGAHRLILRNRHLRKLSVYLFNAAQPRSQAIQITRQKRNATQRVGEIEFEYRPLQTQRSPATAPDRLSAFHVLAGASIDTDSLTRLDEERHLQGDPGLQRRGFLDIVGRIPADSLRGIGHR